MELCAFSSEESIVGNRTERRVCIGETVLGAPALYVSHDCSEPIEVEPGERAGVGTRSNVLHEPFGPLLYDSRCVQVAVLAAVIDKISKDDFDGRRSERLSDLVPSGRIGGIGSRPDHPW